jgi:hypothetical protein
MLVGALAPDALGYRLVVATDCARHLFLVIRGRVHRAEGGVGKRLFAASRASSIACRGFTQVRVAVPVELLDLKVFRV